MSINPPPSDLKPGDRVVEIGGVVVSAAVVTGAVTCPLSALLAGMPFRIVFVGLIVGVFLGLGTGKTLARSVLS